MKNVMPNINNRVPYHVFYDRDPRKPFSLLQTFGCLAWVNIPKAKCKKLDEPAIPAIFIGYDEEHKGWKFLAPSHNLPIFWSNSIHFLQDKSWNDHTDTILIQDTDTLHYKGMDDIEDSGMTTLMSTMRNCSNLSTTSISHLRNQTRHLEGTSQYPDPQMLSSNTQQMGSTMHWNQTH